MATEEDAQKQEEHHVGDDLSGEEARAGLELRHHDEAQHEYQQEQKVLRLGQEALAEEEEVAGKHTEEQSAVE